MKRKIISVLLSSSIIIGILTTSSFALANNNLDLNDEVSLESSLTTIENNLAAQNTNVVDELQKLILYYQALMVDEENNDELQKLNQLITTTEELIKEYQQYQNISTREAHPLHAAVVASALAVFNVGGLKLSAELLTHARDNTVLNSTYNVTRANAERVRNTVAYTQMTKPYGSVAFNNGSGANKDFYLALHAVDYTLRMDGFLTIHDTYDFDDDSYDLSLVGIAVDAMYRAQRDNYLTPYKVVLTVNK